ncbi:MAG: phosphotransferase [Kiritimatiellae bacterium]|nr:phosphotransferase [Kiritimatiellia bacterium]
MPQTDMTKLPRKAVVLAAGLGSRLRPLTDSTPKPLLPVWGEPMIERILRMLESWGVEEIAVNAHHLAYKVKAYCAARKGKAKIIVSEEPEILGTGGALNPLRGFLGDAPFWLLGADMVIEDLDPAPIAEAFERSGRFAACWLREEGPRTVEADPEGRVCNWRSDDAGAPGTYTYCSCALLGPDVLRYVKPEGFSTIIEAYEKAMMDSRFVVGAVVNEAFWWDAGTPERFRAVNDGPQPAALYGDPRLDALVAALGWDDVGAEFLGARGSDRAFWRIDRTDGTTAIAVEYDDGKRPENARYASHAALLDDAGVPVPKVLADLPDRRMLALEELAAGSLEEKVAKKKGAELVKLYTPVVKALKGMHGKGTALALERNAVLEQAFGPELYAWERDLFETYCLKARYGLDCMPAAVRAELEGVAAEFRRMPAVLVHRDFQSSNVLYRADGTFAFIDFQGMRLGPAVYDLASLLYDPYSVNIGEAERAELLSAYGGVSQRELALGAVQRLVQTLGAFGRLESVGQPQFSRHVPRALGNLLSAADSADLDALGALAEDLIAKEEVRLHGWGFHHHHDDDEEEP